MKVGSIVEYVGGELNEEQIQRFLGMGYIIPERKKPYTVRGVYTNCQGTYVYLEEIVNPSAGKGESGYNIETFRISEECQTQLI